MESSGKNNIKSQRDVFGTCFTQCNVLFVVYVFVVLKGVESCSKPDVCFTLQYEERRMYHPLIFEGRVDFDQLLNIFR